MTDTPTDAAAWDANADRYGKPLFWSLFTLAWGDEYPTDVLSYSSCTTTLLRQLIGETALNSGDTVVDLGCGIGGVVLWFARQLNVNAIGVDWSRRAVEIARERQQDWPSQGSVAFAEGTFSETGLPSDSADAVISIDALPFASDADRVLDEVARILRPGGRLVFTARGTSHDGDLLTRLGGRWANGLSQHGLTLLRLIDRPNVSALWHSLDALWRNHEQGLRAELPKATVDGMLADGEEFRLGLDNGRPWFVVTALKGGGE